MKNLMKKKLTLIIQHICTLDKDSDNDKDVGDDKDGNKLKESDLVSHHLTSPSALAVISSLHDLLAVHTVSFGYDDSDDI